MLLFPDYISDSLWSARWLYYEKDGVDNLFAVVAVAGHEQQPQPPFSASTASISGGEEPLRANRPKFHTIFTVLPDDFQLKCLVSLKNSQLL